MTEKMKALEKAAKEIEKVRDKYKPKAEKERAKIDNVYVTVKGEKCYSEDDINDWYAADYITRKECDKYIDKLNEKRETAGQQNNLTKSERVIKIFTNIVNNLYEEIASLKFLEEQEIKKQERWKIAQERGCSYEEWYQEEISRQSEEYERSKMDAESSKNRFTRQ